VIGRRWGDETKGQRKRHQGIFKGRSRRSIILRETEMIVKGSGEALKTWATGHQWFCP